MSQLNLVSAQTSNVCITHHAATHCLTNTMYAIAYIVCVKQFVMSLPVISLGALARCEQKWWDRGRWVGVHTQR